MSVHHVCTKCLWRLEEGAGACGAEVIHACELQCGSWELNLDPLEEQLVTFTMESSH